MSLLRDYSEKIVGLLNRSTRKFRLKTQIELIKFELYLSFLKLDQTDPFYRILAHTSIGEFETAIQLIETTNLAHYQYFPSSERLTVIRKISIFDQSKAYEAGKILIPDFPDLLNMLSGKAPPLQYDCPLLNINQNLNTNPQLAKKLWKQFFCQQQLAAPRFPISEGKLNISKLLSSKQQGQAPATPSTLSEGAETVSVIVSAYNASQTLKVSLASIIQQSWKNTQIIVVDDASEDDTFDIATQLLKNHPNHLILRHPVNLGSYAARNTAIASSTGEFIMNHDADDWAHPEKIALQVQEIKSKQLLACTSRWFKIDDTSGLIMTPHIYPIVRHCTNSIMFRREVLKTISGYDPVRIAADERFEKEIRYLCGANKISAIKKTLTVGHHSSNNLTSALDSSLLSSQGSLSRTTYRESWMPELIKKTSNQHHSP